MEQEQEAQTRAADLSNAGHQIDEASHQAAASREALDALIVLSTKRLASFSREVSMRNLRHSEYQQALHDRFVSTSLVVDACCAEVAGLKLAVETAMQTTGSRIDELTRGCADVVKGKREAEHALFDAQAALDAEIERCRKLTLMHEREEKDCANLEHALDETTRRLLEIETKHNRMVAWNQELNERLRLCHHVNAVNSERCKEKDEQEAKSSRGSFANAPIKDFHKVDNGEFAS